MNHSFPTQSYGKYMVANLYNVIHTSLYDLLTPQWWVYLGVDLHSCIFLSYVFVQFTFYKFIWNHDLVTWLHFPVRSSWSFSTMEYKSMYMTWEALIHQDMLKSCFSKSILDLCDQPYIWMLFFTTKWRTNYIIHSTFDFICLILSQLLEYAVM